MISFKETEFGLKLEVRGLLELSDFSEFYNQAQKFLMNIPRGFYLLLDLRELAPLSPEITPALKNIHKLFLSHGLSRAAVITANSRVTVQTKKISLETGLFDKEIYVNPDIYPDWEKRALKWFKLGIDPNNITRTFPKTYDYSPV